MARTALTGTRIRERRTSLRLKQADLAQAAGISPAYLNLIEHNRRRPGEALIAALAQAMGVEPEALSEGAEGALFDELREAAASAEAAPAPGPPSR
ncbi:MAG: helix-turn-helix transcriptional regulator, partial [Sphingomonadales bacterium]|nr:helix-turn-helix transcriptional regulator [Sphingomonadales bacterium]